LTNEHHDECVGHETHDRDILVLCASISDQDAGQPEDKRIRGVRGRQESLRPLEIQQYGRCAA